MLSLLILIISFWDLLHIFFFFIEELGQSLGILFDINFGDISLNLILSTDHIIRWCILSNSNWLNSFYWLRSNKMKVVAWNVLLKFLFDVAWLSNRSCFNLELIGTCYNWAWILFLYWRLRLYPSILISRVCRNLFLNWLCWFYCIAECL